MAKPDHVVLEIFRNQSFSRDSQCAEGPRPDVLLWRPSPSSSSHARGWTPGPTQDPGQARPKAGGSRLRALPTTERRPLRSPRAAAGSRRWARVPGGAWLVATSLPAVCLRGGGAAFDLGPGHPSSHAGVRPLGGAVPFGERDSPCGAARPWASPLPGRGSSSPRPGTASLRDLLPTTEAVFLRGKQPEKPSSEEPVGRRLGIPRGNSGGVRRSGSQASRSCCGVA